MEFASESRSQLTNEMWKAAVHAYGTAYIFERRANSLRRLLRVLSFVSFGVPIVIGALVLSYGTNLDTLPVLVGIAGAVGLLQTTVSLWALVAGWVDAYGYAIRSVAANANFAQRYEALTKQSSSAGETTRLALLHVEDLARQEEDWKQGITDREKRMGMRAALRKYQMKCAGCHQVPVDMRPTTCGVCGDYGLWPTRRR
jgi:mobilome CxxCx(11)CxxC protein